MLKWQDNHKTATVLQHTTDNASRNACLAPQQYSPIHKLTTLPSFLPSTASQFLNHKHTMVDYFQQNAWCQDTAQPTNEHRYASVFGTFHNNSNNCLVSSKDTTSMPQQSVPEQVVLDQVHVSYS